VIWAETIGLPNLKSYTYTSAAGYPAFLGFLAFILYKNALFAFGVLYSAFGGGSVLIEK
jgi:hypothetical protein